MMSVSYGALYCFSERQFGKEWKNLATNGVAVQTMRL